MSARPEISVVMPFHNSAATVEAAALSVLRQRFDDLELIAIDDGSADDGYERLRRLRDPRLRLHRNEENRGTAATRNLGMDLMQGRFMAPMDADDVCVPRRLERTWRRLQDDPTLGACGGWGRWCGWAWRSYTLPLPTHPDVVRAYLLFSAPFHHDTLLFRRETLDAHGLRYPEPSRAAEDLVLVQALVEKAAVANLPEVLVRYAHSAGGMSNTRAAASVAVLLDVLRKQLQKLVPGEIDDATLRRHAHIGNGGGARSESELREFRDWLARLEALNRQSTTHPPKAMAEAIGRVWFRVCRNSAFLGAVAWRAWRESPWRSAYTPLSSEIASFAGSWGLSRCLASRRGPQGGVAGL